MEGHTFGVGTVHDQTGRFFLSLAKPDPHDHSSLPYSSSCFVNEMLSQQTDNNDAGYPLIPNLAK